MNVFLVLFGLFAGLGIGDLLYKHLTGADLLSFFAEMPILDFITGNLFVVFFALAFVLGICALAVRTKK